MNAIGTRKIRAAMISALALSAAASTGCASDAEADEPWQRGSAALRDEPMAEEAAGGCSWGYGCDGHYDALTGACRGGNWVFCKQVASQCTEICTMSQ